TTRSTDPVFQGRFTLPTGATTTIESPVAEVGWFLRPTTYRSATGSITTPTNPLTFTLYRKQLLVLGYVGIEPFFSGGVCTPNTTTGTISIPSNSVAMPHGFSPWSTFFDRYDISARFERNAGSFIPNRSNTVSPGRLLPNTLADLTRREARFMHNVVGDTSGGRFRVTATPPASTTAAVSVSPGRTTTSTATCRPPKTLRIQVTINLMTATRIRTSSPTA
ncbi:MAG: hypothetical protein EBR86_17740, partial [Planctomycetia bacterium]|nr:hypothetical protein [Planctomycetia bacterium]